MHIPDGLTPAKALARTTHLGIGAHQDDLEFMALHGILECFGREDRWFGGVVCTDGGGSARAGRYAGLDDAAMAKVREEEQLEAAEIGQYGFIEQLGMTSAAIKGGGRPALVEKLREILDAARPEAVYAHNPVDRHPTHLAVFAATLEALRALPAEARPQRFTGCEVWRGLDWLPEARKVAMVVDGFPEIAEHLCSVFRSQIQGGKRYDLAVAGRRTANATFSDSHAVDSASHVILGLDLMPLLEDPALAPAEFVAGILDEFRSEALEALGGG